MRYYHKDFPWGKGMWVWYLSKCLNGNIDAIIKQCKTYDISYLIIKGGDGQYTWDQLKPALIKKIQDAGIKVYSWTFNYGLYKDVARKLDVTPEEEAQVAINCLMMGVDGHVFDPEGHVENQPNNAQNAERMLKLVRAKFPDKFLAYAPFAIIDVHRNYPYTTYGKYCDAVMPQIYHGTMKRTPKDAIMRTYDNFMRWSKTWLENGQGDSVKPLIPLGQTYDNYEITPPFILSPKDIKEFISAIHAYKSCNFWSFQHMTRVDCWEAIRDSQLDEPTDLERGWDRPEVTQEVVPEVKPVATPTSTPPQNVTVQTPDETLAVVVPIVPENPQSETIEQTIQEGDQPVQLPTQPQNPPDVIIPDKKPTPVGLPSELLISNSCPTTIVIKPNPKAPDSPQVTVYAHRPHLEIFLDIIKYVISKLKSLKK